VANSSNAIYKMFMDSDRSAKSNETLTILVVDDETSIRKMLMTSLEVEGHRVVCVSNSQDAADAAAHRSFDLAFVDLRLGSHSGLDLIPALITQSPWMKIVVITAYASIDTAVQAIRNGAADYLPKPFTPAQVAAAVRTAIELRRLENRVQGLQDALQRGDVGEIDLNSRSPAMQRAVSLARQVAAADAMVLVRGESGTGKGVLARAIHSWSPRAGKAFSVVSCPSLSGELLESELFGHVKGAFTSAVRDNPGRVAASEGGTLFLDEIGEMPVSLQPKLLRFLQDREYERVGDNITRRADVRIIAATNANLEDAVRAGRFREDLYYRLNVVQIDVPPLRERPDDVIHFAERFLKLLGARKRIAGFTPAAVNALQHYTWPGNLRELRNAVERAVIVTTGDYVGLEHFPASLVPKPDEIQIGDPIPLDQVEELHIRRILSATKSLEQAAEILNIDSATLWRRRKKYGI
jgi:NtrC-family two-component system response regulator AlgB